MLPERPAGEVAALVDTSPLSERQAEAWFGNIREGRDEEPEDLWARQASKRRQRENN